MPYYDSSDASSSSSSEKSPKYSLKSCYTEGSDSESSSSESHPKPSKSSKKSSKNCPKPSHSSSSSSSESCPKSSSYSSSSESCPKPSHSNSSSSSSSESCPKSSSHSSSSHSSSSSSSSSDSSSSDDESCFYKKVLKLWKCAFHDTKVVEHSGDDATLSHSIKCWPYPTVNGYVAKNFSLNKATYSFEESCLQSCQKKVCKKTCKKGWTNFYKVQLPDVPGVCGHVSTVQYFLNKLQEHELDTSGVGTSFTGAYRKVCDHGKQSYPLVTVNVQGHRLCPTKFSKKVISSLKATINYTKYLAEKNSDL